MTTFNLRVTRKTAFLALGCAISAIGLLGVKPAAAAILELDTPGSFGYLNDAFFQAVRTDDPAGTGKIDSFLRLQSPGNSTNEQGYNTDARPLEFDENNSPQFTRSLLLSQVPIVNIGGLNYRQFILDVNEPNATNRNPDLPKITLDKLQIFLGNAGNLTGFSNFGEKATKIFDLDVGANVDSSVTLTDGNPGSGRFDLLVNILDSDFQKSTNPYVYLYSSFTGAEGGFEEWAVQSPAAAIPTPALLPGLVGLGVGIWRKRKGEQASANVEG